MTNTPALITDEMVEILSCPFCGKRPDGPHDIVAGKVWTMGCNGHLRYSAYAMSWKSADDCIASWNTRPAPKASP